MLISTTGCNTSSAPVAISDDSLYRKLHVPLIETIMYNGTTRRGDGKNAQVFEYSFIGKTDSLAYSIVLSRNAQFNDCAGCIGDWETGMFSSIVCNGEFISLKEFIVQMIQVNGEITDGISVWNTNDFSWSILEKSKGVYQIDVNSVGSKNWRIHELAVQKREGSN